MWVQTVACCAGGGNWFSLLSLNLILHGASSIPSYVTHWYRIPHPENFLRTAIAPLIETKMSQSIMLFDHLVFFRPFLHLQCSMILSSVIIKSYGSVWSRKKMADCFPTSSVALLTRRWWWKITISSYIRTGQDHRPETNTNIAGGFTIVRSCDASLYFQQDILQTARPHPALPTTRVQTPPQTANERRENSHLLLLNYASTLEGWCWWCWAGIPRDVIDMYNQRGLSSPWVCYSIGFDYGGIHTIKIVLSLHARTPCATRNFTWMLDSFGFFFYGDTFPTRFPSSLYLELRVTATSWSSPQYHLYWKTRLFCSSKFTWIHGRGWFFKMST